MKNGTASGTNTRAFDGESALRCANIAEVECTYQIYADRTNLLNALGALKYEEMEHSGYLIDEAYVNYANCLQDYSLTQEQVNELVQDINA